MQGIEPQPRRVRCAAGGHMINALERPEPGAQAAHVHNRRGIWTVQHQHEVQLLTSVMGVPSNRHDPAQCY